MRRVLGEFEAVGVKAPRIKSQIGSSQVSGWGRAECKQQAGLSRVLLGG